MHAIQLQELLHAYNLFVESRTESNIGLIQLNASAPVDLMFPNELFEVHQTKLAVA